MKVVLMHGKNTSPTEKWYPWFVNELEKRGVKAVAPALPNAPEPVMSEWLAELDKVAPDGDTILVGHSRGGVAVLRWLENQPEDFKVKKVTLVATNSGRLADVTIPSESNYGFYTDAGYDFNKIRAHCDEFVVLHSTDDKWVPFAAGEMNAEGLKAKFLKFDDRGHFGRGVNEIPELMSEIL
jgi:predicted alpha/beta hydrolase family esterase